MQLPRSFIRSCLTLLICFQAFWVDNNPPIPSTPPIHKLKIVLSYILILPHFQERRGDICWISIYHVCYTCLFFLHVSCTRHHGAYYWNIADIQGMLLPAMKTRLNYTEIHTKCRTLPVYYKSLRILNQWERCSLFSQHQIPNRNKKGFTAVDLTSPHAVVLHRDAFVTRNVLLYGLAYNVLS